MRARVALCALVVGAGAACGSRSPLDVARSGPDAGAAGGLGGTGAGGAGSGGLGGAGTGGASGGAPSSCLGLALDPEVLTATPLADHLDRWPTLSATSDDSERLTLVFMRETAAGSNLKQLKHVSFRPWLTWPGGTLGPLHDSFAHPDLASTYAAGPGPNERLALLVDHGGAVVSLAQSVDPEASGGSSTLSLTGTRPQLVTRSDQYALAGRLSTDQRRLLVSRRQVPDFSPEEAAIACGLPSPVGDAEPTPLGFLIATSNGAPIGSDCSTQVSEPPERIDIIEWRTDETPTTLLHIPVGETVHALKTVRTPSALWVVYSVAGGTRIDVARVGLPALDLVVASLSQPGDWPLGFDASGLGERLLITWGNDPAGNPPDLVVSLLDAPGDVRAQLAVEPPFVGAPAILGSPAGDEAVLAWSEQAVGAGVRVARLRCLDSAR
ncbi:MAG: hypothetical protein KF718_29360 [Polyangiaceae bacterium]|nr:hypothetical protein [Polyangiaceae bacterium]